MQSIMETQVEVEGANCRWPVSACADAALLALERPLKVDVQIGGLQELVRELHSVFSRQHVNVQDVQKLMAAYKSNPKDWKKYAKFDRFRYTRNLVDAGNGAFNLMLLCWGAGHASSIHDHADAHCFMKVLSGSLQEVRYEWPRQVQPAVNRKLKGKTTCPSHCEHNAMENKMSELNTQWQRGEPGEPARCAGDGRTEPQHMEEIGRTALELDDTCYINDALGLHRVENPSAAGGAVSLHVYSPPFAACRVFDERTGTPTSVKVTFWSVRGRRLDRITGTEAAAAGGRGE